MKIDKVFIVLIIFLILSVAVACFYLWEKPDKTIRAADDSTIVTAYADWGVQSKDANIDIETSQGSVLLDLASGYIKNTDGTWSLSSSCVGQDESDIHDNDLLTLVMLCDNGDYVQHDLAQLTPINRVKINWSEVDTDPMFVPDYQISFWNGSNWEYDSVRSMSDGGGWYTIDFDPVMYASKVRATIVDNGNPVFEIVEVREFEDYEPGYSSPGVITSASGQVDGQEGDEEKQLIEWTSLEPTQSTPANTSIGYQFRTSSDELNWTDWTDAVIYSGDPIDLTSLTANRYLQVRSTLSTSDGLESPQIDDYTINYHTNLKPNQPTALTAVIGD